ncbi:Bug family tripartite tricarboxylate transporter substrate binding protein [Phytohabitans rumicis]|uniref:C4-dicarboxylate ABC transporter substrate-binding protein n=1 Tax=Phytohabitans rumicis TaxID=1076125 RepID=A0A6V8LLS7_9ACTN|nr:tripartite tricarboxylate transporter substrate binding protein [Phytohabitans rumicis]GFJ95047.1 C4-dicarboxylate ABC transporter substrate-binding protein [Phytohabitans rumicis]
MRRRAVLAAAALLAGGCGSRGAGSADLRIMVPNAPGSGYDITARTVARALDAARIVRDPEVFNLPGASGTVGLQRLVYERGNGDLMMLMGLGVVGAQQTEQARARLSDTTPIARLIEEPALVVVPNAAPYRTLADLITAWRANPAATPAGGGSSVAGPDHLALMLMAEAAGIAPARVNYASFDGGGDLLAAVFRGVVAFGVSGIGETVDQVRSNQLRVLAVTSPARIPGVDAPTLREVGVDVVFANWRGLVAPPDLSGDDRAALREVVSHLHGSAEWRDALSRNGWTDAYLADDAFGTFIAAENARIAAVRS